MGERFGEAGRRIHLQQEIGDARGRDLLVGEPAEFGKNRTLRFSGHP
uniref:Uncharacterized protein n=1 Tax=Salmonella enterica subsp. enterica serovar Heidelberg TaxID=611 RepID=H9TI66_SALET|nr:hypothetical protein pSH111_166_186 [Salmonella enterica subsp. enterica serovar Heidelberg]